MKSLYLILNLLSISYPLYKSWDTRVNYYQKWPAFFKALPLLLVIMIPWDALFTARGVWGFNERYNLGVHLLGLPLEEWMFFIAVPFACTFIYEVIVYYDHKDGLRKFGKPINAAVLMIVVFLLVIGYPQWYTSVTMAALIPLLLYHQKSNKAYLGRFYGAFAFILIPFFVVNGILTGSFIEEQVVWYNMDETFGIRLFTIPFEDTFYCLFMMLFLITFYERLKVSQK